MTSATIAYEYRKLLNKYALETTGSTEFVQWQGHDFSFRGMSSLESACYSGAGHLLSFTGTDTIPAISFLEEFYNANIEKELVGASVPATEHSVMCMGTKDDEIGTFERLIDLYKNSPILSIVSDTWNLWTVCTEYLPKLKEKILAGNTKIVIRPDSGDPVDIICGYTGGKWDQNKAETKGVIELLWDVFGGTVNKQGYKVLDPHIGAIYGDSITLERAEQICERLKAKGFASTNIVLGIGSYTYQYNTRDTFGFAVKATYGEVLERCTEQTGCRENKVIGEDTDICKDGCVWANFSYREIFKDPITDDGTKRSAKGLLKVTEVMQADSLGKLHHNTFSLLDQCTKSDEKEGALKTVFLDGNLVKFQTLSEIRARLASNL